MDTTGLYRHLKLIASKLVVLFVALTMGVGLSILSALAWVEPTAVPPGSNAPGPIHEGGNQIKDGSLSMTELTVNGNVLVHAPGYVNFGTVVGSTGYGFRSNAGRMQFKNATGSWTSWTDLGSGISSAQYGYTNYADWDACKIPNNDMTSCEILGTIAQAQSAGWTEEVDSQGSRFLYKEILGQSSVPWTLCSMNGYTTQFDWQTYNFIVKKGNGKWYAYFGTISGGENFYNVSNMSMIANCWR
jgi:hypothetical protein